MSGADVVKLYGMWASYAVRRVEWALKMKGIEYEYIEEDLANKSPSLLKYNPLNKQVPVLVHKGRPIVESFVIIEYIDEVWKDNSILPEDPYERAMARFWATYAEEKFCNSKKALVAEGEERAKAIEQLEEMLGNIDKELKGKKFFGGECIGFTDIALGWMAFWLGVAEEVGDFKVVDPKKFPSFVAWIKNLLNDPLIKENLPSRDATVAFFHNFRKFGFSPPNGHNLKVNGTHE